MSVHGSDEEASALDPRFAINLLLKFLGPDDGSAADQPTMEASAFEERPDTLREQAGVHLWDLSCSSHEATGLIDLNAPEICAAVLQAFEAPDLGAPSSASSQAVTPTSPRAQELAAGILANLASHRPLRSALRSDSAVLRATGTNFLASMDPPTLRELTRFFTNVLREGDEATRLEKDSSNEAMPTGEESAVPGAGWAVTPSVQDSRLNLRHVLSGGVLDKAAWLLHGATDAELVAQACQFFNVLAYFEPALFRSAALDPDVALASGCAGVAAERLSDTDFNPTSVLRLIEALTDTLASPPPANELEGTSTSVDVSASVARESPPSISNAAASAARTSKEGVNDSISATGNVDDKASEGSNADVLQGSLLVCLLPALPAVADLLCRAENSATVLGEAAVALAAVLLPLDEGRGGGTGLKAAKSLEVDLELATALVQSMLSAPEANARTAAAHLLDRALAYEEERGSSQSDDLSSIVATRQASDATTPQSIDDMRPIRDLIRASGPAIRAARLKLAERDFAAGSDFFNSGDEALPPRVQREIDSAPS